MEKRNVIIISLISILIFGSVIYYSISKPSTELTLEEKENLAKCLTQKEVYLYGTINCPNCEVQKEEFGEAAKELTYINCFIQKERCEKYPNQKIFPYWGFEETILVGPVPLTKLKKIVQC